VRLLVVSNRLPVTVVKQETGFSLQESVGGLVSGLSAYLNSLGGSSFTKASYIWVGWPGVAVNERARPELRIRLQREFRAHPVFVSEKSMDKFYFGFCNKTLWPLFHYFPSYAAYDEGDWAQYQAVNKAFCHAVLEVAQPDDIIWVHDYHLMLLPKLLREQLPSNRIGFFLHIPFPSYEIFRLLPNVWHRSILEGLLGADLIGFHTEDYTGYFLNCLARMCGLGSEAGTIQAGDRTVRADTFPMGIDFQKYAQASSVAGDTNEMREIQATLGKAKVILSIDRLDYSKGIINRMRAYEAFLSTNPQWRGKVTLAMVVVPSRVGVEDYQRTKRRIDEMVGRINGRFGNLGWTPILYQYRFLPLDPLVALYRLSDVALVTPLRDGMNLIAKEYIASRIDQTGVLILSEMAGAAQELTEAIITNPNDIGQIAEAIKQALEMPEAEQVRRNRDMQYKLERHDVVQWASDFLCRLEGHAASIQRFLS
jgi:trehalose 6-phosphate synthase/phosphatase